MSPSREQNEYMATASTKTTFRGISARARLLLDKPEGVDADWKVNVKVDSEDFVAFANSAPGGAILLGVDQKAGPRGEQVPVIKGCDVRDGTRLMLVNKAKDCLPPIEIQVFMENLAKTPFLRVEIPSGKHKPYCTKAGTYKTRADGRNAPLSPPDLLAMFVDIEGRRFVDTFRRATDALQTAILGLRRTIDEDLHDLRTKVDWANEDIHSRTEGLEMQLSQAVEDITGQLYEAAESQMRELNEDTDETRLGLRFLEEGLEALLKHQGLDDLATLYWRPRVHQAIHLIRGRLKRSSPASIYQELRKHSPCPPKLLLKLCREKLGTFSIPKPRRRAKKGGRRSS